ncbi:hypothetical protein [Burkholderia sp. MSMB0265]|uniref:hypothetical protein n=1 Tax=Burkholderia sp. MSMB0265 TaxID=1637836 RepID=UPI0012E3BF25|nr:hypothetical protein [Burkholderia sp. MSMB0265]
MKAADTNLAPARAKPPQSRFRPRLAGIEPANPTIAGASHSLDKRRGARRYAAISRRPRRPPRRCASASIRLGPRIGTGRMQAPGDAVAIHLPMIAAALVSALAGFDPERAAPARRLTQVKARAGIAPRLVSHAVSAAGHSRSDAK